MKLNTGKVAFPIEFDNGDKQEIYFNPNDPDLMIRMKNFETEVTERIKEIADIELTVDGKPKQVEEIEIFEKAQNILKEEMDRAFGGSISAVVFKHCSPFAIVGGDYFVVHFVEAITPEIEKHIKNANAEIQGKMARHIDKYKK